MGLITLGAEEASSEDSRMGPLAKLLTGVAIVGGAVVALKRGGSSKRSISYSDDWEGGMTTKRLPRESMREVVFGRRR